MSADKLRAAIAPFADLGGALAKHGDKDDSPLAAISDDLKVLRGGLNGWHVTAGQLRAAYLATVEYDGDGEWAPVI